MGTAADPLQTGTLRPHLSQLDASLLLPLQVREAEEAEEEEARGSGEEGVGSLLLTDQGSTGSVSVGHQAPFQSVLPLLSLCPGPSFTVWWL